MMPAPATAGMFVTLGLQSGAVFILPFPRVERSRISHSLLESSILYRLFMPSREVSVGFSPKS